VRRRLEDNINMDLREIGFEDSMWAGLILDHVKWWPLVLALLNLGVLLAKSQTSATELTCSGLAVELTDTVF